MSPLLPDSSRNTEHSNVSYAAATLHELQRRAFPSPTSVYLRALLAFPRAASPRVLPLTLFSIPPTFHPAYQTQKANSSTSLTFLKRLFLASCSSLTVFYITHISSTNNLFFMMTSCTNFTTPSLSVETVMCKQGISFRNNPHSFCSSGLTAATSQSYPVPLSNNHSYSFNSGRSTITTQPHHPKPKHCRTRANQILTSECWRTVSRESTKPNDV